MSSGQKEAWENPSNEEFLPVMSSVYISDIETLLGKKYSSREDIDDNMADDLRKFVNKSNHQVAFVSKLQRVDVSAYSNNAIRAESGRFYMANEVDAHIAALKQEFNTFVKAHLPSAREWLNRPLNGYSADGDKDGRR